EAAIDGANEVGMALAASTLTTVAVFLPIVFVGGIAAELFRDLSLAVAFALLMSLVVAVTFVPMVAARVRMRVPQVPVVTGEGPGTGTRARPGLFDRLQKGYARFLRWILARRWVAVAAVIGLIVSGVVLLPGLGQEFLPVTDTGEIAIRVRMPYGTVREQTEAVVHRIEQYAAAIPEVETVFASVGSRDGSGNETGVMHIGLVPKAARSRGTEE